MLCVHENAYGYCLVVFWTILVDYSTGDKLDFRNDENTVQWYFDWVPCTHQTWNRNRVMRFSQVDYRSRLRLASSPSNHQKHTIDFAIEVNRMHELESHWQIQNRVFHNPLADWSNRHGYFHWKSLMPEYLEKSLSLSIKFSCPETSRTFIFWVFDYFWFLPLLLQVSILKLR